MKTSEKARPNELLSHAREQRHWTQEEVATKIGAPDAKMVGRWERGIILPTAHYRQQLMTLFGKSAQELGLVTPDQVPFWQIPYRRNSFFTGRAYLLDQLSTTLTFDKSSALKLPLALSGLGGVGKTQLALEYAYRYSHMYHTVAWLQADSPEVLATSFAGLAELLRLPERTNDDLEQNIRAVKNWLAKMSRWLLILDNVESLFTLESFLPSPLRGHILLTTRTQISGTAAQVLEVETMPIDEAALFLLRRAKIVAIDASPDDSSGGEFRQARAIAVELGGLPLALDQAGAYIEETACGLAPYLELLQIKRKELLQRRGPDLTNHPEPVATTWSLSFDRLRQENPAAIDLLTLLAFLSPDAIAEEIILDGVNEAGSEPDLATHLTKLSSDPLLFNQAIKDLRRFSLVRRQSKTRIITIHRLVQAMLLENLQPDEQRLWAGYTVRAICKVFPDGNLETLPQGDRLLAQISVCERLIGQWQMRFPEAAQGLRRMAMYYLNRSLFEQSERISQQAIALQESLYGPEHLELAGTLSGLAMLYLYSYRYTEAEPLYKRIIAIRTALLGSEHHETGSSLADLAWLYTILERYDEAERLFHEAVYILQRHFGEDHLEVGSVLNNWAGLYMRQGNFAQAETMLERAIAISEQHLSDDHPDLAINRHNLAKLYSAQGKYQQAESLLLR
ncbi:MAG TPA: tetratricopeptide repeat protein, partial [Ktedonobacteraceae bacterium]|nr:tetratricopeptide repeat protein [Ktedonobacteraceae bacterium]